MKNRFYYRKDADNCDHCCRNDRCREKHTNWNACPRFRNKTFYENVEDNEVLPLFYSNPEKYTFLLQIFFLNKRFLAIKDAFSHDDNVLDRSIYEDSMLFHLNADLGRVSEVEVKQYEGL